MSEEHDGPPIDDELRAMLFPEKTAEEQIAQDTPPGRCPIHGRVGFGRFMLIDQGGKLLSDHCVKCVSRVFVAMFGVLEMPE